MKKNWYKLKNNKKIILIKNLFLLCIAIVVPIWGMLQYREYDYRRKQALVVQNFLERKELYAANIEFATTGNNESTKEYTLTQLNLPNSTNENDVDDMVTPIVLSNENDVVKPLTTDLIYQVLTPTPIAPISTPTPTPIVSQYATIDGDVLTFPDEFTITYYCPCKKCCGQWSYEVTGVMNTTASGTTPVAGRTIAVCSDQIPYGTTVIVNGHEYVAEDTGGGIGWNRIDIYCDTHEEALQGGRHKATVSIKR